MGKTVNIHTNILVSVYFNILIQKTRILRKKILSGQGSRKCLGWGVISDKVSKEGAIKMPFG